MDNDNFNRVPSNISSVIDLLEDKGISWGHYQEDMPYSGFEGVAWVNQLNGANDYVRKHSKQLFWELLFTTSLYRFRLFDFIGGLHLILSWRMRSPSLHRTLADAEEMLRSCHQLRLRDQRPQPPSQHKKSHHVLQRPSGEQAAAVDVHHPKYE